MRSEFDSVVQDDIIGFDGHPGPFWHYAINASCSRSICLEALSLSFAAPCRRKSWGLYFSVDPVDRLKRLNRSGRSTALAPEPGCCCYDGLALARASQPGMTNKVLANVAGSSDADRSLAYAPRPIQNCRPDQRPSFELALLFDFCL